MATYDFRTPRLFVEPPLAPGAVVELDRDRTNYLVNVLRLGAGDPVLVFNGRDGEWRSHLVVESRRRIALAVDARTRSQTTPCDLQLLFAPLKHARLDYMVQKAVELGVGRLSPVLTHRTQVQRINLTRMRANAIEAAEQCGILDIPPIDPPITLKQLLSTWSSEHLLVFCDEDADVSGPISALSAVRRDRPRAGAALIVGPEGGFNDEERAALLGLASVVRLSLGPRILRADTAAVAALALVQSVLGDWR